jgi:Cellulose binding domain
MMMVRPSRRERSVPLRTAVLLIAVALPMALAIGGPSAAAAVSPADAVSTAVPAASAGPVFSAGFEDGTTDGFRGDPASVSVTLTTTAHTGSAALAVGSLTGYGQGARVTLPAGLPAGYYGASAQVRLASGQVQDMRLVLPDSPAVSVLQTGISRSTGSAWVGTVSYFGLAATSLPVSLRVEPVAHCTDAPAVPLPYLVDDVVVSYYGTVPPPLPLLPTPACPLAATTSPSATPTSSPSTTPTTPPVTCRVTYAVTSAWPGGFQAAISLQNLLPQPVVGWTLSWTLPAGQTVQAVWGGTAVQTGNVITVSNPIWNPTLAVGGAASLGLIGGSTGTVTPVPVPIYFLLNGSPCTVVAPA